MQMTFARRVAAAGVSGAVAGLVILALAGTGLGAGGNAVSIDNFTFGPDRLVVPVGTTVTWTNADDIPHTVVATDKSFRSKALDTDDNYTFTFTTPGTYDYFCSLHPTMKATVVVEAAADKR